MQVNFLALDFDLTILDIHTSGRWPGTPEQLTQRIRPFFQALIPVAVAEGKLFFVAGKVARFGRDWAVWPKHLVLLCSVQTNFWEFLLLPAGLPLEAVEIRPGGCTVL